MSIRHIPQEITLDEVRDLARPLIYRLGLELTDVRSLLVTYEEIQVELVTNAFQSNRMLTVVASVPVTGLAEWERELVDQQGRAVIVNHDEDGAA